MKRATVRNVVVKMHSPARDKSQLPVPVGMMQYGKAACPSPVTGRTRSSEHDTILIPLGVLSHAVSSREDVSDTGGNEGLFWAIFQSPLPWVRFFRRYMAAACAADLHDI